MEGSAGRAVGGRRSAIVGLPAAAATCLVLLVVMAAMAAFEQAEAAPVQSVRRRKATEGEGEGGFGGGSSFDQPATKLQSSGVVRFSNGPAGSLWPAEEVEAEQEGEEGEDGEKKTKKDEAEKRLTVAVQLQRRSGQTLAPYEENDATVAEEEDGEQQKKTTKKREQVAAEEACGPVIPSLETPECHVQADGTGYQLRKYPAGRFWTVATVRNALNYDLALLKGFLACFNYISGHNSRNEVIEMTGPVRIQPLDVKTSSSDVKTSGSDVKTSASFKVAFFVPAKYKSLDDLPLPTDPSVISFEEFTPGVKAVYGPFGGFPDDKVYFKKWDKLKAALDKDGVKYDESTLMFAGYSSPFEFINRKQEVWVDVISSSDELAGPAVDAVEKKD
ncbi:hypothetical protein CBR_g16823 [Chara braunii]|uniref:Uncharacterized protein n=1 Tax=Chara braunii TaxID=69332 RepID=A0A388KTZ6_CHABU|nr:hypothetical protein CBR_g16823 [Chara braunii]|eukprot:GBG73482.1 hypothetical protein CBR_g16823 [Chara braunii]